MSRTGATAANRVTAARQRRRRRKVLETLIEEATVDAYNEDEAFWGLYTCVEDHVKFPFTAYALGDPVVVVAVDAKGSGLRRGLRVNVQKGRRTYSVDVCDLEIPHATKGAEWLEAYRLWQSGG